MTVKNEVPTTAKTNAPVTLQPPPRAATVDPAAVATIPPDFPNTPPYNYPLIRADRAGDDLDLFCDITVGLMIGDVYRYLLDGVARPDLVELTSADLVAGKVTVPVDGADISESGVYTYQYQYRSAFETHWSEPSDPTVFVIDVDPPGRPFLGRLHIDPDVEKNGLTADKLDSLGGYLPALVPSYQGRTQGDIVIGYLKNTDGTGTAETAPVQIAFNAADDPLEIHFLKEAFEAVGDGIVELKYKVIDLAGNESPESGPLFLDVFVSG
ncbi:hypothetical protein [Pandoraea sp. NPDC087047]|uniref:hypothetical protein n=1 Tax=Pandoraea sp. NPDC087047 TaxID=3364390 RepID=UPI0037F4355A